MKEECNDEDAFSSIDIYIAAEHEKKALWVLANEKNHTVF